MIAIRRVAVFVLLIDCRKKDEIAQAKLHALFGFEKGLIDGLSENARHG